jgi:hypothetical protein
MRFDRAVNLLTGGTQNRLDMMCSFYQSQKSLVSKSCRWFGARDSGQLVDHFRRWAACFTRSRAKSCRLTTWGAWLQSNSATSRRPIVITRRFSNRCS